MRSVDTPVKGTPRLPRPGYSLPAWQANSGLTAFVQHRRTMTSRALEEKAKRLQRLIEEETLQAHGLIPMFVRAGDYRLPTREDYRGAYRHRHLLGKTEEEIGIAPMHVWRAWENTATDTAYYLAATAYQYRCTGDPQVLAICRRTLGGLKFIHALAVAKGERGFLPKPYGGAYSNQTSGDQVQCVTWGLAAYRAIAPREDRADIDMLTADFARWEIKTGYISPHGYFAYSPEVLRRQIFGDEAWSKADWTHAIIYVPLLNLAWQGTGDARFVNEIRRWYEACETDTRFSPPAGTYSIGPANWRMIYLPALLMEMDPVQHELWRSLMLSYYQRLAAGILPDGTTPTAWTYDSDTGRLEPEPGWGGGLARTGRSAILAMSCATAQRWFGDADMIAIARNILERLDEGTFRFVMPFSDEHPLAPGWEVESKLLDGDSLTAWLCAFWEGRWRGYW